MRKVSFERAKALYVHRYTMEHVPAWVQCGTLTGDDGVPTFYAPQYASDREWYDNTVFPGEPDFPEWQDNWHCYSRNQTWPLGKSLSQPYKK